MKQSNVLTNAKAAELLYSFNTLYEKTNIAYKKDNLKMVEFLEVTLDLLDDYTSSENPGTLDMLINYFNKEIASFAWCADHSL